MGRHLFKHGQPLPPRFVAQLRSEDSNAEIASRWGIKGASVHYWRGRLAQNPDAVEFQTSSQGVRHG